MRAGVETDYPHQAVSCWADGAGEVFKARELWLGTAVTLPLGRSWEVTSRLQLLESWAIRGELATGMTSPENILWSLKTARVLLTCSVLDPPPGARAS